MITTKTLLQRGITRKGIQTVVEKAEGSYWHFFRANNRTSLAIIQNLYVQITYSLCHSRVTLQIYSLQAVILQNVSNVTSSAYHLTMVPFLLSTPPSFPRL